MMHATSPAELSNPNLSDLSHPVFDFRFVGVHQADRFYAMLCPPRNEHMAWTRIVGIFHNRPSFQMFCHRFPHWGPDRFAAVVFAQPGAPDIDIRHS